MPPITLLDIAKANGSDQVVGMIDETIKAHPEISIGAARTIKGLNYKTLVRTGLPTVGFRAAGSGTVAGKAAYENRLIETYIMNPRWECDKAIADAYEDGAAMYIAMDATSMLEAAMIALCKQFYYGTGNDALGFPGLIAAYDSANMVVDAGGTTEDTCSSVWGVKFGPKFVNWVYGNNGQLTLSELTEQVITPDPVNAPTARLTMYCQELLARPGLQVGNLRVVGRIKKLTEDAGHTLTDGHLGKLYAKFPVGLKPDVFFMSRRSAEQLRASRTAVNPTGQEAPYPENWNNTVKIEQTDSISDIEKLAL